MTSNNITMKTTRRSPLALAVLALLDESPMHPYRMQQLIKERGKDQVVNVRQRTSIYQTIARLERDGLIHAQETARDEHRPERTIYAITEAGRETCRAWLREMLATPSNEFPELPAAISFLPLLTMEDALQQLERRESALQAQLAELDASLEPVQGVLPRLFLLESEYLRTMLVAERDWVVQLVADLRARRLTWSAEELQAFMDSPAAASFERSPDVDPE